MWPIFKFIFIAGGWPRSGGVLAFKGWGSFCSPAKPSRGFVAARRPVTPSILRPGPC